MTGTKTAPRSPILYLAAALRALAPFGASEADPPSPNPSPRDELGLLRREIAAAYSRFNSADDPALCEAEIFEIKSLEARYSRLLRLTREGGGSRDPR